LPGERHERERQDDATARQAGEAEKAQARGRDDRAVAGRAASHTRTRRPCRSRLRGLGALRSRFGDARPEVAVKLETLVLSLALAAAASIAVAAPVASAANSPNAAVLRDIAAAEDRRDWAGGALASALKHADAGVRARAVLAVGRLQDTLSIPALLPLLSDKVPNVRREAAFALGQIGHKSAREALEKALGDNDAFVKENAAEALGKLGDKAATAKLLP